MIPVKLSRLINRVHDNGGPNGFGYRYITTIVQKRSINRGKIQRYVVASLKLFCIRLLEAGLEPIIKYLILWRNTVAEHDLPYSTKMSSLTASIQYFIVIYCIVNSL